MYSLKARKILKRIIMRVIGRAILNLLLAFFKLLPMNWQLAYSLKETVNVVSQCVMDRQSLMSTFFLYNS